MSHAAASSASAVSENGASIAGPVTLGVGTVLVSSMFVVLKSFRGVPAIVRASWRLQTTFLALVLVMVLPGAMVASKQRKGTATRTKLVGTPLPLATILSGIGYASYNVGLCVALERTSLLRASVLSQCAPLVVVLYRLASTAMARKRGTAAVVVGRVPPQHIVGVVLSILGTAAYVGETEDEDDGGDNDGGGGNGESHSGAMISSPSSASATGDVAAAIASVGYAIYISCGRSARRKIPVQVHLPCVVFIAMIIVSAAAVAFADSGHDGDGDGDGDGDDSCNRLLGWACRRNAAKAAYLGMVCGGIAVGLINWSLDRVSALQAAMANSTEPVFASVIGVVAFSEPMPSIAACSAAGVIILAMLLCSVEPKEPVAVASKSIAGSEGRVRKECV